MINFSRAPRVSLVRQTDADTPPCDKPISTRLKSISLEVASCNMIVFYGAGDFEYRLCQTLQLAEP